MQSSITIANDTSQSFGGNALAYNPNDGLLYGSISTDTNGFNQIAVVDFNAGTVTPIAIVVNGEIDYMSFIGNDLVFFDEDDNADSTFAYRIDATTIDPVIDVAPIFSTPMLNASDCEVFEGNILGCSFTQKFHCI